MGKYLTQVETDFIQQSINLSNLNFVMDVGAEAGRFSQLSNSNAETIGIDINSYGLKRLKQKAKDVNVVRADARKIPFKTETFDTIFMVEVLDYIPELEQALGECHRTLKKGASLVVSFGNKTSLKSILRELHGKSYRHSYAQVMRNLKATGFLVKEKRGYNWLLFGRMSQSSSIKFLAKAEQVIGFRRIPRFSPWVIVHAVKPT